MLEIISRIIIILITLFIVVCLGMSELFNYNFSKKFKIVFWIVFVLNLVLAFVFSKFIW